MNWNYKHRRDLIAMLSLVGQEGIRDNSELYRNLIKILPAQISRIDKSFLEVRATCHSAALTLTCCRLWVNINSVLTCVLCQDIEQAGNNFLIPALQSLLGKLTASRLAFDGPDSINKFQGLLNNQFPSSFLSTDGTMECNEDITAEDTVTSARRGSLTSDRKAATAAVKSSQPARPKTSRQARSRSRAST